jgi:hypothetical protein
MQVKVLKPRLMSGQEKGQIITLHNIENKPKGSKIVVFGGIYEVI